MPTVKSNQTFEAFNLIFFEWYQCRHLLSEMKGKQCEKIYIFNDTANNYSSNNNNDNKDNDATIIVIMITEVKMLMIMIMVTAITIIR